MASNVYIKLYVNNKDKQIKRFVIGSEDSLDVFLEKVKEAGIDPNLYLWQYKDEENDVVTFSTAKEFEVIRTIKSSNEENVVRLYFEPKIKRTVEDNRQRQLIKKLALSWFLRTLCIFAVFLAVYLTMLSVDEYNHHYERERAQKQEAHARWVQHVQREQQLQAELNRLRSQQHLRDHDRFVQRAMENVEHQNQLQQEIRDRVLLQKRLEQEQKCRNEYQRRLEQAQLEKARIEQEQRQKQENEQRDVYKLHHDILNKLGYMNREMNEALLRVHSGEIRRVVEALQNFR